MQLNIVIYILFNAIFGLLSDSFNLHGSISDRSSTDVSINIEYRIKYHCTIMKFVEEINDGNKTLYRIFRF